uniref:CD80-like immunoglobulin C2-set domain-containing protein n=1 Tax=Anopheles culicifacies TaxID=139723 RepID=A0A182MH88_9DIPT
MGFFWNCQETGIQFQIGSDFESSHEVPNVSMVVFGRPKAFESQVIRHCIQPIQALSIVVSIDRGGIYPQFDPIINGLQHNGVQHNYALGDFVVANCSSDMSSPPARLYWYINDRSVPSEYLQPQHETTVENDGFLLRSRTLEVRFYIDEKRLGKLKGKLVLKCLARIDSIPQATRESSQIIYTETTDELNNEKLINWRGSFAPSLHHTNMHRLFVVLCIALGFFTWLV